MHFLVLIEGKGIYMSNAIYAAKLHKMLKNLTFFVQFAYCFSIRPIKGEINNFFFIFSSNFWATVLENWGKLCMISPATWGTPQSPRVTGFPLSRKGSTGVGTPLYKLHRYLWPQRQCRVFERLWTEVRSFFFSPWLGSILFTKNYYSFVINFGGIFAALFEC